MPPLLYPTIALSAQVTGNIDLTQYPRVIAIDVPAVTSGELQPQGAFNTTSASFVRMTNVLNPGSGDLAFSTAAGSRMLIAPFASTPPWLRLALSVPQAAVRTFTLLVARK